MSKKIVIGVLLSMLMIIGVVRHIVMQNAYKAYGINEQVIFDDEGLKITALDLDFSDEYGPRLKISVENNGDEKALIKVIDSTINGFMYDSMFSLLCEPGQFIYSGISYEQSILDKMSIEYIKDVEFKLMIEYYDSDLVYTSENIRMETSLPKSFKQKVEIPDNQIFNQEGVEIWNIGYRDGSESFHKGLKLFVKNNHDADIHIYAYDVAVNGYCIDPMFTYDIISDKCGYTDLMFLKSVLEDKGITDIKELDFKIKIFNKDPWETIVKSDVIHVELKK